MGAPQARHLTLVLDRLALVFALRSPLAILVRETHELGALGDQLRGVGRIADFYELTGAPMQTLRKRETVRLAAGQLSIVLGLIAGHFAGERAGIVNAIEADFAAFEFEFVFPTTVVVRSGAELPALTRGSNGSGHRQRVGCSLARHERL